MIFHTRKYVVCIRLDRNGTLLPLFIPTNLTIIQVGLFTMIIINVCISWAEVLNDFEISFVCEFGSFVHIL